MNKLLIVLTLLSVGCVRKHCTYKESKVTTIGTCSNNGRCGVLLEDGGYKNEVLEPVLGMPLGHEVCVTHKSDSDERN